MSRTCAIVIMCKIPFVADCKTRMKPRLNETQRAELQDALLKDTFDMTKPLPFSVYIAFSPSEGKRYVAEQLGTKNYFEQTPGDLGARMLNAIRTLFAKGYKKAIVIGGDIPTLQPENIRQAIAELDRADVCLGPASDGGYYLIGLKEDRPELFDGIDWGTERVFQQTMEAAAQTGLEVRLLPEGMDLDEWEDLVHFYERMDDIQWEKRPLRTEQFIRQLIEKEMEENDA